ncbi:MAG: type II toxin-antitoxin system VapC family toxin [Candidatus Hodarchaeales archaeon]
MIENITLDSNVFRNQTFIDWLSSNESIHDKHFFPLITYVEVLVWYEMRGLTREDLDDDLRKIKTEIVHFSIDYIDNLMKNIRTNPSYMFRHHARDFLIGTTVEIKDAILITNNKRHFMWLPAGKTVSPEEYLEERISL